VINLQIKPKYELGQDINLPMRTGGLLVGMLQAILYREDHGTYQTSTLVLPSDCLEGTLPSIIEPTTTGVHYWIRGLTHWVLESEVIPGLTEEEVCDPAPTRFERITRDEESNHCQINSRPK
jgi:hypothetical protein